MCQHLSYHIAYQSPLNLTTLCTRCYYYLLSQMRKQKHQEGAQGHRISE